MKFSKHDVILENWKYMCGGSALIVVLWVIGILSVLTWSFAFDAHIESRITSFYKNRIKAQYLARSGIEIAEMLILRSEEIQKTTLRPTGEEEERKARWNEYARNIADGLPVRGLKEKLGAGFVIVDIVPEPSRRNINRLGDTEAEKKENLERILEVAGVPEEKWSSLIDSFLDWTDPDDVQRAEGAESDFYLNFEEKPYRAKNGPLDTVDELLMIKGFSRVIVEGGILRENEEDEGVELTGLQDLLTTYGDGKVDINAVSDRVLKTIPGIDDVLAGAILEEREGFVNSEGKRQRAPFKSVDDLYTRVPGLPVSARKWLTTGSSVYRIVSEGRIHGISKRISCIARKTDPAMRQVKGGGLVILRWIEEG